MIRTKIAKIVSPTRFVLAAGADQGVTDGMEFIIYELSDPIFDPDTKEPLGQLELHKGRVRVIHVQEKLATVSTMKRKFYRPGLADAIRPIGLTSMQGEWIERLEELPVESTTATAVMTDLTVRVGDLVRSVE
jgi:hypothetical protein